MLRMAWRCPSSRAERKSGLGCLASKVVSSERLRECGLLNGHSYKLEASQSAALPITL